MKLKLFERADIEKLLSTREGELKLGEKVHVGAELMLEELQDCPARFVILGIPEDIGPRANLGRGGSDSAWAAFLPKFLNIQENQFLGGHEILLLGELDVKDFKIPKNSSPAVLRAAVSKLDSSLSELVEIIVKAGKIPVLIGGGHNNSYGAIKGSSMALGKKINAVNLDPHADYRALEGRHSGNGFSYAKDQGFLNKYAVLALHENYNSQAMLDKMQEDQVNYLSYESIFIREEITYKQAMLGLEKSICQDSFGIELDLDAIANVPSSAQTPSGVSVLEARQYLNHFGANKNAIYLHLPEAAPSLVEGSAEQVGKLLSYLVSDFIKARRSIL